MSYGGVRMVGNWFCGICVAGKMVDERRMKKHSVLSVTTYQRILVVTEGAGGCVY